MVVARKKTLKHIVIKGKRGKGDFSKKAKYELNILLVVGVACFCEGMTEAKAKGDGGVKCVVKCRRAFCGGKWPKCDSIAVSLWLVRLKNRLKINV